MAIITAVLFYGSLWAFSRVTWLTLLSLLLCAAAMAAAARRRSRRLRRGVYVLLGLGELALWAACLYYRSLPLEPEAFFDSGTALICGANALLVLAALPIFLAASYDQHVRDLTETAER